MISILKLSRSILVLLALSFLAGCSNRKRWDLEREPTSDLERNAIAAHVEKIMAATPKALAGHDQDWDDAINAAEHRATELFSRPILREWIVTFDGFRIEPTGRWKFADINPEPSNEDSRRK